MLLGLNFNLIFVKAKNINIVIVHAQTQAYTLTPEKLMSESIERREKNEEEEEEVVKRIAYIHIHNA